MKRKKKHHRRRLFLLQLGSQLIEAHVRRRQQQPQSTQRDVKLALQGIGKATTTFSQFSRASSIIAKRRCQLCSKERDRKIISHCARSNAPCCSDHHILICTTCGDNFLK